MSDWGSRADRAARALAGRGWIWAAGVAVLAAWPLVWSLRTPLPAPPPVLEVVGDFDLTDQSGRPFGARDLAGRVWIASFVDTRCGAECASLTRTLGRIQGRTRHLEPALHLVSFSVDPAGTTPEELAGYARAHRASPRMWTFVTGADTDVRSLAGRALDTPDVGEASHTAPAHGAPLVLVDGAGRVRGRYPADDPEVVDRVVRDAALLVNAPRR